MSVVQLRPKAPFLYGWCGTEFSFQTPRWCGSMAEQLICNQQVVGSTPTTSSKRGKIPEWPKGADCKSVGTAFGGSNPPLPTKKKTSQCGVFFYAGNRGFCAVYTARRVAPEPPFRCWTLRYKISQGVPSGRLPRYARNDIKCATRNSIKKVY